MNLYTAAGGLFDTHVTWEDIEEDMQRELDTVASFGPNKTAKNIGEGNGFMSIIVLIDADWQHVDRDLPDKFIVKIPTTLAIQRFAAEAEKEKNLDSSFITHEFLTGIEQQQKKVHNSEVTVYNHIMQLPEGKLPHVKIFYMRKFSEHNPVKGYIIMKYMDNIKPIHIYENVRTEDIKEILRAKAVMEAMSLKFTEEERKSLTINTFSEFFSQFIKKDTLAPMVEAFRRLDTRLADKIAGLEEIFPDNTDLEWADQLADELGMQRVLCHGDMWSVNILWRQKGDFVTPAALIDFQTAHMGCPAYDFARLFSSCLSGKDRREHWEELLEEFYGYLKEEIDGIEIPYTLEQLKEAYCRIIPICGIMIVPVIVPLFDILCNDPDEEQKKKSLDIAMEKTECLLDDMFYYHERNMKRRRGEQAV